MTRTALVTGASAGLGVEFARQLANQGMDLVLVARRAEQLERVAKSLADAHGVRVRTFSADLGQSAAPEEILSFTREAGLEIDYLVNNAGSAGPSLLEEPEWAPQAEFLELMMLSVTHLCHLFLPSMKERGFGRVINVSSFSGRLDQPAGAHYGPSKAYRIALSEELALILRVTNVPV